MQQEIKAEKAIGQITKKKKTTSFQTMRHSLSLRSFSYFFLYTDIPPIYTDTLIGWPPWATNPDIQQNTLLFRHPVFRCAILNSNDRRLMIALVWFLKPVSVKGYRLLKDNLLAFCRWMVCVPLPVLGSGRVF